MQFVFVCQSTVSIYWMLRVCTRAKRIKRRKTTITTTNRDRKRKKKRDLFHWLSCENASMFNNNALCCIVCMRAHHLGPGKTHIHTYANGRSITMFNTIKIVKTIDCWILRHFALSTFVSLMRLDWLLSLSPINISSSNGMDIFLCHCHCHCRFHCHCQKFIMAIFLLRAFHFSSEIVNSQPYNKIKRNLLFPNFYVIPDHRCVFNGFCLLPTSLLLLFFRSLLWSFDVLVYHWFYWTSGHFPTAYKCIWECIRGWNLR